MKQLRQTLLITLLLSMLGIDAFAYNAEIGGIFYNFSGNKAIVTYGGSNQHYSGDVTIPKSVTYNSKTYIVSEIGQWAFLNCDELTSLVLPSTIEKIGSSFGNCKKLKRITINSGTIISEKAYSSTSSFQSIFGNQVEHYIIGEGITSIAGYVFAGCSGMKSITIPSSITRINDYAFSGCTNLTSVYISNLDSWCKISSYYRPFTKQYDLYLNNSIVTDLTIPSSVKTISNHAFAGCKSITDITFSNGITSIGDGSFQDCPNLINVSLPSSVTSIGKNAFECCVSLPSVNISTGITAIGAYAFYGCQGLTELTIPSSLTGIGNNAFGGCPNLTNVTVNSNSILSKSLLGIFGSQVEHYTIGEGVTSIGSSAFSGCSNLTSVTIPSSVTSIGSYAFYECSGLTNIILPDALETIGREAFKGCSGLISVTIPNSVTDLGEYAFYNCKGLKTVVIGNSVKTIGDDAFNSCSALTSVNIPNSVLSIGKEAFSFCKALTSVSIGNSVVSIGDYAFQWCDSLSSVDIPNSMKTIGHWAFMGCKSLETITIPNSVTSLGASAFHGCRSLKSVIIGNGITQIEYGTFKNCEMLSTVTIPNSVIGIGESAFYGCKSLESIELPDNITNIGKNAFPSETLNIYVNKGTRTLFNLWKCGYGGGLTWFSIGLNRCFDKSTEIPLPNPHLEVTSTQTSLEVQFEGIYDFYDYSYNGEPLSSNVVSFTGMKPGDKKSVILVVSLEDDKINIGRDFSAVGVNPYIAVSGLTATSFQAKASYKEGDATIESAKFYIGNQLVDGNTISLKGLEPNRTYNASYVVKVKWGENLENTYDYSYDVKVTTLPLTLTTLQPKVVSSGNVIVAAESNIDDAEKNVGFEWRRTDWSDDFASNSGTAYLYEGMMEGYIRNLNTEKLWKYRPYYVSDSGTYYYGEWIGLDPTNTSYFEPTVHTYANITVDGNSASIEGLTLPGSDGVASQGFQYWETTSGANEAMMAPAHAPAIPGNAKTVEVSGQVMTATLTGLNYGTTYNYVAFVKTTSGETFYGEVRSFTTEPGATGIYEITDGGSSAAEVHEVARYNLNGQPIDTPERGINIIRYSDGSTRKVVVK